MEGRIGTLETAVSKVIEEAEAQARSNSAMLHKLNYDNKQELFQHRREVLAIQEGQIKYNGGERPEATIGGTGKGSRHALS